MAKKVYIDFELKYKEAVKNLDEMQSEYSKLEKQVDKTSDSQKELGGILDSTTGGAVTKFKSLKGTLGTVIKSFKSLRVAILATGIGALVLAVGSLSAMFTSSEEGQNKFAKLLMQIGVVAGNVIDILSDLGSVVFNVFTGNFKAAGEALNEVTEGIKNFGEETKKEIKIAGELADMRARADKEERQLLLERAEADRKVAELREIAADKENVSVEKRIEAIKEAGRIAEEITEKEIATARLRFEAKRQENLLSKSTKEDLDEQARLQARLIELETARLRKQKALTAEITTSLREAQAERNAILAEQKAKEAEEEKAAKEKQDAEDKAELDRLKKLADDKKKLREKELADEKAIAAAKNAIQNASAAALVSAFNILASTDKKNKKLQAAMLIATNAVGIAQNIINTNAANARLTLEAGIGAPALILANKIRMFTGIAASVAATAQGLSALKVGGSPSGVSVRDTGGALPQAPAFNVVGASATNQLAESIAGQQQQPIQAYVVSNDVSTAQELDRNIITGASIG
tara:strand:- start:66 stop:1631 length:1566 start_codon:yes stop_codon:yes gene_type:complete